MLSHYATLGFFTLLGSAGHHVSTVKILGSLRQGSFVQVLLRSKPRLAILPCSICPGPLLWEEKVKRY